MEIPDGSEYDYDLNNAPGFKLKVKLYAWGWLGSDIGPHRWVNEATRQSVLKRLAEIPVSGPRYMGMHTCEVNQCGKFFSNGSLIVVHEGVAYKSPEGVAHYIEHHSYCPPPAVIEALVHGEPSSMESIYERTRN